MKTIPPESSGPWDYLIVTAANDRQAAAYSAQIQLRRDMGLLARVRDFLVIPDWDGRRIGSGGSTLQCLGEVLRRESPPGEDPSDGRRAEAILSRLRILIVHAGGDSRRLPAYSPCGKIFIPLPGGPRSGMGSTLFDRLVPDFLGLPAGARGAGQVVIAAGDALIRFDPAAVRFGGPGITALGAPASPREAARHGVLCPNADGSVRVYLQKPDVRAQTEAGAIGADGRSVLDIGIMSLDAGAAARLLGAFRDPPARAAILSHGIDLYREICCALGTEATLAHYAKSARSGRSSLSQAVLASLFADLRPIPLRLGILDECSFLHFGSTSQLISSGLDLVTQDLGAPPPATILDINNDVQANGAKLAGILAEQAGGAIVVGIGLNVSASRDELPVASATSLAIEGAQRVAAGRLLVGILGELRRWYLAWAGKLGDAAGSGLHAEYQRLCATLGREVRVTLPGDRTVTGVASEVDRTGRLVVRSAAGPVPVSAGDVIHVR